MLYTNGKKVNRLQNCLHAFYHECKRVNETINQYELLFTDEDLDKIMDKYPKLFFSTVESMRYRIIIGMGNMIDNDKKSLSITKVLNLAEQEGIEKVNMIIKEARKELSNYSEVINNIKILRDRMYAHIDIEYSLEEEEIFDIDFEFLNEQIKNSKGLIKFMMKTCVEISKEYDGDGIHLGINWLYDK